MTVSVDPRTAPGVSHPRTPVGYFCQNESMGGSEC